MSDYFEEMSWQPVEPEHTDEHQMLLLARFFMENGIFSDEMDSHSLAPAASAEVVRNLPEKVTDERCAICLKPNANPAGDEDEASAVDHQENKEANQDVPATAGGPIIFKVLPCTHAFHATCILPWLNKVYIIFLLFFLLINTQIHYSPIDQLMSVVSSRITNGRSSLRGT